MASAIVEQSVALRGVLTSLQGIALGLDAQPQLVQCEPARFGRDDERAFLLGREGLNYGYANGLSDVLRKFNNVGQIGTTVDIRPMVPRHHLRSR